MSAPGRKSVKAALRKKDQRIGAPIVHISTPKRKRTTEDVPHEGDNGSSRKRAKAANGDDTSTQAGRTRTDGSARAPKQYGGRKANRLTTPMSAQKNVDYDLIPGTSPATSQQQSANKSPAPDSKKSKKNQGTSKAKATAAKPLPKGKVKEVLPKLKPKPKRGSKAVEGGKVILVTTKRAAAKPVPERTTNAGPRPLSPEPIEDFDEQDLTIVGYEHEVRLPAPPCSNDELMYCLGP